MKVVTGNIYEVIATESKAYVKIISVYKEYKNVICVKMLKALYTHEKNLEEFNFDDDYLLLYTTKPTRKSDNWQLIVNQDVLEEEQKLDLKIIGDQIYQEERPLRVATMNDRKNIPKMMVTTTKGFKNKIDKLWKDKT